MYGCLPGFRSCSLLQSSPLVVRAAVSAYPGRYRGESRLHAESDLHVFLRWCTEQDLDPLIIVRADVER